MDSKKNKELICSKTEKYIHEVFEKEGSGHDWWHISRVRNLALKIAENEGGNFFIIELSALLHDLDDWKLIGSQKENRSELWLKETGLDKNISKKILQVINEVSFKGAGVETHATSLEAKIVQDADRLDAIGAIGIARTFAYGGSKRRLIYHPEIKPEMHMDFESYKKSTAPTINHFYEKLFLIKDRLNTKTAKKIALQRHNFMEQFLVQFFNEWDNKK